MNPIIHKENNKYWHNEEGQSHREDGPAIEWGDGTKYWYINGKQHREDGPAVEYRDGSKFWFINDELHREDGPAVEYGNGHKLWYYHNQHIKCSSQEEFEKLIKLRMFW